MNSKQININKPLGKTPVEMIELLKKRYPEYSGQKVSYAGRLDPMAHGVLVLLVGDSENRNRRKRELSDKEYLFTMVFGIESDTYDICGIPKLNRNDVTYEEIKETLPNFKGKISQRIPKYSAYKVRGKPMYVQVQNNSLKSQEIPNVTREIKDLELTKHYEISGPELLKEVKRRLRLITRGDFRQAEILKSYEEILEPKQQFLVVEGYAYVSSGTYIRTLCHDIGKAAGTSAISMEIYRTRSGDHRIEDALTL
ncbi:hypothetical protein IT417_03335 [bacterium]|nr:hypothetical protein [bacterium]